MKLASLKHGRDGRLILVSRDLTRYCEATDIAPTLQAALDDWASLAPRLEELPRRGARGGRRRRCFLRPHSLCRPPATRLSLG
jgi:hypothetical protein